MTLRSIAAPLRCMSLMAVMTRRRSKPIAQMSEMICSSGTARVDVRATPPLLLPGAWRGGPLAPEVFPAPSGGRKLGMPYWGDGAAPMGAPAGG
eukprot:365930-Chlamydomonas_euryale.AAC.19